MSEFVGILIYLLGLGLLFLELFIPSGGLIGIGGVLCTVYGIWQVFDKVGAWAGAIVIVVTIAYLYFIVKFWGKLIKSTADLSGSDSTSPEASPADIVGKEGVTLTILRPAGFAQIGDLRLQVVAQGSYLAKDRKVRVIEVVGNRIVVAEIEEEKRDLGDEAS
jgi:membrane-bound serine protease (ClpP class)